MTAKKDMTLRIDVNLGGTVNEPKAKFTMLDSFPPSPSAVHISGNRDIDLNEMT